jgi:hypothetical protein
LGQKPFAHEIKQKTKKNTDSIPVYLDWIKYLSPMKYAFEAYCLNEFTGLQLIS